MPQLIICFALMAIVPYLLCGINSAIIVTKIRTGKDIRTMGSGNAGLTNTLRTQGKLSAALVLLGDVAKGVLCILLVHFCFLWIAGIDTYDPALGWTWVCYCAGIFGCLGHVFPVYFGFKGGKGVLVTVAILLGINWIPAVLELVLFGAIVAISRYVSLGSVICAILYPFFVLVFGLINNDPCCVIDAVLAGVIGAIIVLLHRSNIKRLLSHSEKKLGQKQSQDTGSDNSSAN